MSGDLREWMQNRLRNLILDDFNECPLCRSPLDLEEDLGSLIKYRCKECNMRITFELN